MTKSSNISYLFRSASANVQRLLWWKICSKKYQALNCLLYYLDLLFIIVNPLLAICASCSKLCRYISNGSNQYLFNSKIDILYDFFMVETYNYSSISSSPSLPPAASLTSTKITKLTWNTFHKFYWHFSLNIAH